MTLNIFGKKIRVLKKKHLAEDVELAGYYDPVNSIIAIHETLVGDDFFHTLVHEITHAVLHRTGVMQSRISPEIQEIVCENIATAITENFDLKQKKHKRPTASKRLSSGEKSASDKSSSRPQRQASSQPPEE